MQKNFDALIDVVARFQAAQAEKADLDASEKQARDEIAAAVAGGPLDDGKISRRISAANTTLDAVAARRNHLEKTLWPILGEMRDALRYADSAYTRIIRSRADEIAAKFYTVNAQFYGGNERECRRHLNHEILPAWNLANRAMWRGTANGLTEENAISTIRHFVGKVKANITNLNLEV
ncbi:MAG TPA: hypothetical protein VH595_22025 [Verrucomicrobiae bacterium]|jgi:hypothetical protein|nr:hypothetical protein [Verrucomicrobiae bacterium]